MHIPFPSISALHQHQPPSETPPAPLLTLKEGTGIDLYQMILAMFKVLRDRMITLTLTAPLGSRQVGPRFSINKALHIISRLRTRDHRHHQRIPALMLPAALLAFHDTDAASRSPLPADLADLHLPELKWDDCVCVCGWVICMHKLLADLAGCVQGCNVSAVFFPAASLFFCFSLRGV